MKSNVPTLLAVVLLAWALAGCQKNEAEPVVLKMGHFANEHHPGSKAALMFAQTVEERTGGEVRVTIFPNNQLGTPGEVLNQNMEGSIDMSLPSHGQLAVLSPKFNCIMLPFLFENYQQAHAVVDGPFTEWVLPDLEARGLVFLSNWEWGFRHLSNNVRPVYHSGDVDGLTIRTPPELPNQFIMEALGASVSPIAWPELPMALKQRLVDGQENPLSVIYSYKIYESQRYLTLTGHSYKAMVHVISKKAWDRLEDDQKRIVREESQRAGQYMRDQIRQEEAELIVEMKEMGIQVIRPDLESFKEQMGPVYQEMENVLGQEKIRYFLNMVETALNPSS